MKAKIEYFAIDFWDVLWTMQLFVIWMCINLPRFVGATWEIAIKTWKIQVVRDECAWFACTFALDRRSNIWISCNTIHIDLYLQYVTDMFKFDFLKTIKHASAFFGIFLSVLLFFVKQWRHKEIWLKSVGSFQFWSTTPHPSYGRHSFKCLG